MIHELGHNYANVSVSNYFIFKTFNVSVCATDTSLPSLNDLLRKWTKIDSFWYRFLASKLSSILKSIAKYLVLHAILMGKWPFSTMLVLQQY